MKKKWIITLMTAMALVLFTSQVAAGFDGYGRTGSPRADCPQMTGHWASELGLTETQMDKLRLMRQDFIAENNAVREQLFSRQQEMRQLWAENNVDREKIHAKQNEINKLKNRLYGKTIDYRLRMRNEVLTDEQRENLTQMMQDRSVRRGFQDGRPAGRRVPGRSKDRQGRMGW